MIININSIGKFKNHPHKDIFELYVKRIGWNVKLKELEVKKSASENVLKEMEGELLLNNIDSNSTIILLDERGKNFNSREFAQKISQYRDQGVNNITFIIGGANGVCQKVKDRADLEISLSKLTFPHLMVRSILAEQIYRAYSIINNHPYHRD